ncbi:hypothetical protein [Thetidibacter halocola]|uniref:hypothetical protein n=1 Tax=Thetidibacter halocola TaxID=2827239 RepID=UPI001BAAD592|nr:hypothetical protein [Thetidibacter halocola]
MIGRTQGGLNTKRHTIGDGPRRPISAFILAGQVSGGRRVKKAGMSVVQTCLLLGHRACRNRHLVVMGPEPKLN